MNAVAELHLPAGAGAAIRESGRRLASSSDVALRSRTADTAVVALGSGRYRFEVTEGR